MFVVSSHDSLTELLSKPLWAQTIYPFYSKVIIEVDYTQQQNLISKPLRNAGCKVWIKHLGQSLFQTQKVHLHSIEDAVHILKFASGRCVFLIK